MGKVALLKGLGDALLNIGVALIAAVIAFLIGVWYVGDLKAATPYKKCYDVDITLSNFDIHIMGYGKDDRPHINGVVCERAPE